VGTNDYITVGNFVVKTFAKTGHTLFSWIVTRTGTLQYEREKVIILSEEQLTIEGVRSDKLDYFERLTTEVEDALYEAKEDKKSADNRLKMMERVNTYLNIQKIVEQGRLASADDPSFTYGVFDTLNGPRVAKAFDLSPYSDYIYALFKGGVDVTGDSTVWGEVGREAVVAGGQEEVAEDLEECEEVQEEEPVTEEELDKVEDEVASEFPDLPDLE
jgi:hypothetical protein